MAGIAAGTSSRHLVLDTVGERLQLAEPHHPGVALEGVELALGLDQQLAAPVGVGRFDDEQHLLDAIEALLALEVELLEEGAEDLLVHPL